jgi:molybdate transport system substrate-binding protein
MPDNIGKTGEETMNAKIMFAAASALLFSTALNAAEIKVLSTQAIQGIYRELVPQFEKASGHKVTTIFSGTLDVQKRIAAGETYDLIIMAGPDLDKLIAAGKVVSGSRVDLAKSGIGVAVRMGAPKPDIRTSDGLKKALLSAKFIGHSSGPSGQILPVIFQRMGIADAIKGKLKQTPSGVLVGTLLTSGEADIGFQQVSELLHFPGINYVGPLPPDIQHYTTFSIGIQPGAKEAAAAKAWIMFIKAPVAAAVFRKGGMEPF